MPFGSSFSLAAMAVLAASANAHMTMNNPKPFGKSSLNSSPLDASGSDFPCKQRPGVYEIGEMNNIEVGVPQELSFIGGATHGGGSCQVSVTLDKEPTKESQWKVVHSIIGGCPSNAGENLSGDPTDTGSSNFQFTFPDGMPNGEYTLAWTWYNKIGNREMYMNCAPITVTGGSDDQTVFNSLPDMFVANIGTVDCKTSEGEDIVFPNPGQSVQTGASNALGSNFIGSGCAAPTPGSGSGEEAPAPTPAPESPQLDDQYGDSEQPPPSNPGGVFAPGANPGTTAPATSFTTIVITTTAADSAAPTPPSGGNGSSGDDSSAPSPPAEGGDNAGSGSCGAGYVSCSNPGETVCIGEKQFGICGANGCALAQDLAEGTPCREIWGSSYSPGYKHKRSVHHMHGRIHRRHAGRVFS